MNILLLSWRDPKHPLAGGAEQVMHEHAKGWIAGGHSVTLFSSRFEGSMKEEILECVNIVREGNQYLGVQISAFFYYQQNKDNIDIVIDQFHGLPFFTPLYVNKPKLAVIQETAREVWFLNHFIWPLNWIAGLVGYLAEPFIFQFYKTTPFMTGSESAKADVAKFGIPVKNITVVSHGVIVHKVKKVLKKESVFTVVYLGVLSKDKDVEDALEAFSLLSKKGEYQFWVIGKPETEQYLKKIQRLVSNLGLGGKVKFWGYVSHEKKFGLLARAHVLVNPSIREGWGLVNIEANSMSIPVVAYKSPGLVDSVKNGKSGLITLENTPESIAESVNELASNKDLYSKLQKGATDWSKQFTWKKSCASSLKLIENIPG